MADVSEFGTLEVPLRHAQRRQTRLMRTWANAARLPLRHTTSRGVRTSGERYLPDEMPDRRY